MREPKIQTPLASSKMIIKDNIDKLDIILQDLATALAEAGPDQPDDLMAAYLTALRHAYDLRNALYALDRLTPFGDR